MTSADLPDLAPDPSAVLPIYRQIYERIRDAVLAGRLAPGARLPSARSLASQLSIARGTVEAAYQLLAGEGYVVGRGAAGTIVDPTLGERMGAGRPRRAVRRRPVVPGMAVERQPAPQLFQMGLPALDAFPRKLWSRLAARSARAVSTARLVYQDPTGEEALRRSIARYLGIARGIACAPEQVFVTAGFQGALGLVTRALMRPGDRVWVEDPGYFLARNALRLAGATLVPVPVDGDGIDVDAGRARAPGARFAVVTPSHQFPLGATLPVARRLALLDWAAEAGAWIVEDDYDGEFHYRGRPLPALKSLDGAGRVLYVGTFSKVLFPGLCVGYLVATEALADRLAQACEMLHPAPAALAQATVAAFMDEGHFARHVKRMRQLYAERRSALADALRRELPGRLGIELQGGGMHIVARLPAGTEDVDLARRLDARGLGPVPLSASAVEHPCGPGLLIGFPNVPVEGAPAAARRLREALDG